MLHTILFKATFWEVTLHWYYFFRGWIYFSTGHNLIIGEVQILHDLGNAKFQCLWAMQAMNWPLLGFIVLAELNASTAVCRAAKEDGLYDRFNSLFDWCLSQNSIIFLGDFSAITGMDRAPYELSVGSHNSGNRNDNSFHSVDFVRLRTLRFMDYWYQRPELHHWTWYCIWLKKACMNSTTAINSISILQVLYTFPWKPTALWSYTIINMLVQCWHLEVALPAEHYQNSEHILIHRLHKE